MTVSEQAIWPDDRGRFGEFGGKFVPATLMAALEELEAAYATVKEDDRFQQELSRLLHHYAGRPTALYYAENLTRHCGGARIYLKREDLAHTGAHKINNALGQALLAKHMGKERIIAGNGRGTAWRGLGNRLRHAGAAVRRVHGRRGHSSPGPQRLPHAPAGGGGHCR